MTDKIEIIELSELRLPEDFLIIVLKDKKFLLQGVEAIFKLGDSYYARDGERTLLVYNGEIKKGDLSKKKWKDKEKES